MSASLIKTGGKIASITNGTNGVTQYVYFGLNCHDVRQWSLAWKNMSNITLTLEFTDERLTDGTTLDNALAAQLEALTWDDQTQDRTGEASHTTNNEHTVDEHEGWYLGRVKIVPSNATNTIDIYFNTHV